MTHVIPSDPLTHRAGPIHPDTVPVSVVIPCYRCAATIGRAVASVAAQTRMPSEVILVDDASNDGTADALARLAQTYPPDWIKVVRLEANAGAGEARNAGWDRARGEFVAFLDADDAWHPRKIEIQYDFMRRNPEVALSGHLHRISRTEPSEHAVPERLTEKVIPYRRMLFSNPFITPSAMVRRDLPYRFAAGKRHMEDFLLWLTIAAAGHKVVRLDVVLAYIFKAPYGETGLSAELAEMERAELDVYDRVRRQGRIGNAAYSALKCYSLAKYGRRLLIARLLGRRGTLPWLFPLVYLSITYSITALLIVAGVFGNSELAADIAIVHAATVATFYAFSANTRNLILSRAPILSVSDILRARLLLVLPLGTAALLLSVSGAGVSWSIAGLLVLRRCIEWFNDIQLCQAERDRNVGFAAGFLVLQCVLFAAAALALVTDWTYWPEALAIWAVTPLIVTFSLRRDLAGRVGKPMELSVIRNLVAHAGSTAISGFALYAFRLLVLLLLTKALAGELFAALAIGSFIGTLFANVLGPSVELHRQPTRRGLPLPIRLAIAFNLVAGLALSALAIAFREESTIAGKSTFFWLACGLSLIGGSVMVKAQQLRLRVLRSGDGRDVLGPDVLIHVAVLASAPLAIGLFGPIGATSLYLVNAFLAYIFYGSSQVSISVLAADRIRFVASFFLVFPLFFQLSGRLYNSPDPVTDSGGVLLMLPLPVSILACFAGIILLSDYRRAARGFAFVFAFFTVMLLSTVMATTDSFTQERTKLLLLIQFLLPAFGFILGQMASADRTAMVEKGLFWACAIIMPTQLAFTWLRGEVSLTHSLYVFSVYQHWQFVPVVLASALLISFGRLRHESGYGRWALPLAALSFVYALSAYSALGSAIAGLGLIALVVAQRGAQSPPRRLPALLGIVAVLGLVLYPLVETGEFRLKTMSLGMVKKLQSLPCAASPFAFVARPVVGFEDRCVIRGVLDLPQGYLLTLRPHQAERGDVFRVTGEIRKGAITVGLVKDNSWIAQKGITAVGPFTMEIAGDSGPIEGMVAANLRSGEQIDVVITRVEWITTGGTDRPVPTASDRGTEVLPRGWADALPTNLVERIGDWALFGQALFASPKAMFLGHERPMDRSVRTSAHNYFLDLAYNFGLISLMPVLVLLGYTLRLVWRHRRSIPRDGALVWLCWIVFFLVAVDSNFKVTLRQPYPGIFAFFAWGLLISRLGAASTSTSAAAEHRRPRD